MILDEEEQPAKRLHRVDLESGAWFDNDGFPAAETVKCKPLYDAQEPEILEHGPMPTARFAMSRHEVAAALGISGEQVRIIERSALRKLAAGTLREFWEAK